MTRTALLYPPREKWRTTMAFGVALVIHFAAIALANVHPVKTTDGPSFSCEFTSVTFEEAPPNIDPTPQDPDPMPTPPPTDNSFPEETSTPRLVRRPSGKPITPIVKLRSQGSAGSLTWSSAKVLAVNAPRPEYPYEARRQKITGEGIVAMTVDPVTGNVRTVSMAKGTGSPVLDNAALSGFRRWRFKPGTVSTVRCPITFTLVGASY
jgi:TonB family protein